MIAKEYLPPEINAQELHRLMELVKQIEDAQSGSSEAQAFVKQFNTSTGKNYTESDFREYDGAVNLETFVKGSILPEPPKFSDVPDSQFHAILQRLRDTNCDEAEQGYWIRFLERNLDCNEITDIIYWSDDDPSDAEILMRAKARKRSVIVLPPNQD